MFARSALAFAVSLWSPAPGSATVVFQAPGAKIVATSDDGSDARTVTDGRHPVISPDGTWLAYLAADRRSMRVMPTAGGPSVAIARGVPGSLGGHGPRTTWSADSTRVATTEIGRHLVVYDVRTGRSSTRYTFARADGIEPSFSPTGRRVAFTQGDISSELEPIEWATTSGPRQARTLMKRSGVPRPAQGPVWGPRGIAMYEFDGTHSDVELTPYIFVSDLTGGGQRVAGSDNCGPVAWTAPTVLLAACYHAGSTRADVVLLQLDGPPLTARHQVEAPTILSLSNDKQTLLAIDGYRILSVDVASGAAAQIGVGQFPTWSG